MADQTPAPPENPRLLVLTDITSLTAGVREPDDGQSLVRLLLYANEIDIEGLVASSNLGHGQTTRPELIRQAIAAYAQVWPSLLRHRASYPAPEQLLGCVRAGQPIAGPRVPVWESIGAGKDTEASELVIALAARPDPRPLWVAVWGGTADLAQALWRARETLATPELAALVARLRVHAIGDQDSTGAWIKAEFPDLFYITRGFAIRGMYRGGDMALCGPAWVEEHVRVGHGALGALYPNYDGGDIWSRSLGRVRGVKEGDTPSFLGLIDNGMRDDGLWAGWGGSLAPAGAPGRLIDATDAEPPHPDDPDPRMAAVYRWRPAYQADFQARLDWCVRPYDAASHPPLAVVEGAPRRPVAAGETVALDAGASSDPDGGALSFRWRVLREHGAYRGALELRGQGTPSLTFTAPPVSEPAEVQILLEARGGGDPPLTGYRRVVVRVEP